MNLLVENESTHPISRRGEKSFALLSIRPFFHASGMNRPVENASSPHKNINLGEVVHLPPCIVATGGKAAPCRIFVCGYAFLQIAARLRHAVICHDRRFCPHFFQTSQILSPSKYLKNRHLIARDGGFLIVVLSVDDR